MSELRERLKEEFKRDKEYREAYTEDFLNTSIAAQIKVIREQRGMTQAELAERIGTKQAGISRIENVNYSAWKISTLKKIAFALGTRLKVSFETFGSLLDEAEAFSRKALERPAFEEDPAFQESVSPVPTQVNAPQSLVSGPASASPSLAEAFRQLFTETEMEKEIKGTPFKLLNLNRIWKEPEAFRQLITETETEEEPKAFRQFVQDTPFEPPNLNRTLEASRPLWTQVLGQLLEGSQKITQPGGKPGFDPSLCHQQPIGRTYPQQPIARIAA